LLGIFDFLKIFCFNHPGLIFIFTKKGFLKNQAVRIRVKGLQLLENKFSHNMHRLSFDNAVHFVW
jgi:hypothetical protein